MSEAMNQLIRDRRTKTRGAATAEVEPVEEEPVRNPGFGRGTAPDLSFRRPASASDRLRAMVANRPRARGEFRAG